VTARELDRRRHELESELVDIARRLMPLCAMHATAVALQKRRATVLRELTEVRAAIAQLSGERPGSRAAARDRGR